jgi:hypothetical protein
VNESGKIQTGCGSPEIAADFFDLLFGRAPADYWILIWEKTGKRSTWFKVDDLAKAADIADTRTGDIYFGVSLSPKPFGRNNRCPADQAAGIVGVWADIDIRGEAHKSTGLPETLNEARELAGSLGLPPTVSVDSGHGLQPYWLFDAPWILKNDTERRQACQLVESFQAALRRKAETAGWTLDSTHDLARVLRVPGTTNRKIKGHPAPVRILSADGPRYDRAELARAALAPPSSLTARVPSDRELALSALAALHPRRAYDYKNWLDVGMALHSVDSSGSMLAEWERWSRLASEKYEEGACAAKWKTFTANGGLTLGSLIHWAREDGWTSSGGHHQAKTQEQPEPPPQPQTVTPEQHVLVMLDHLRQAPHHARTLARILRDAEIGGRNGSY